MKNDERDRLPALAAWLKEANPGHPLVVADIDVSLLRPLDKIIHELENAQPQPLRLARKRRAFQALKSEDALIEQRAELLVGSLLAAAGIPFEFAVDHPDLVLVDAGAGIEVGTRKLDGPRRLYERIAETVRAASAPGCEIVLTFDQRLMKISETTITEVATQVASAAMAGSARLRFEGLGLTVAVAADSTLTAPLVVMFNQKLGTNLDGHVEDVKREIENKIEEKRRQTSKMPTILLLDFIRVADAWMISNETWTNELHDLIERESGENGLSKSEGYVGFALMFSPLDSWLPTRLVIVVNDHASTGIRMTLDQLVQVIESQSG